MAWQDRLFTWVDQQLVKHPAIDMWLERQLHAHGLHGPAARHLLKTRLLPEATLLVVGLVTLLAVIVCWRVWRRVARRRSGPAPARSLAPAAHATAQLRVPPPQLGAPGEWRR